MRPKKPDGTVVIHLARVQLKACRRPPSHHFAFAAYRMIAKLYSLAAGFIAVCNSMLVSILSEFQKNLPRHNSKHGHTMLGHVALSPMNGGGGGAGVLSCLETAGRRSLAVAAPSSLLSTAMISETAATSTKLLARSRMIVTSGVGASLRLKCAAEAASRPRNRAAICANSRRSRCEQCAPTIGVACS